MTINGWSETKEDARERWNRRQDELTKEAEALQAKIEKTAAELQKLADEYRESAQPKTPWDIFVSRIHPNTWTAIGSFLTVISVILASYSIAAILRLLGL